jgi:metal-responsive CopG/Arc/MetJ family transcriptional regulator
MLGGVIMVTQTKRGKDSISITIEPDLIAVVDEIRKETNSTRSGVISRCLEELARKRTDALMEEGYKAMAKENKDFAKLAFELQRRVALGGK